MANTIDTSFHRRRMAEKMQDPEFRKGYEQARREIEQIDEVVRTLDALRIKAGISKTELARNIGRNPSSIRRLFTSEHIRPELSLIASIASELDAEIRIVPLKKKRSSKSKALSR